MHIPFAARLQVPDNILISQVGNESVLLDLNSERYFGLNETGANIWDRLTNAESIQAGYETLLAEYDVPAQQLQQDIASLLEMLCANDLVKIVPVA